MRAMADTPCGTRTRNLRIRSPTPCPLGQGGFSQHLRSCNNKIRKSIRTRNLVIRGRGVNRGVNPSANIECVGAPGVLARMGFASEFKNSHSCRIARLHNRHCDTMVASICFPHLCQGPLTGVGLWNGSCSSLHQDVPQQLRHAREVNEVNTSI